MKGLYFSNGKLAFRADLPMPQRKPGEALVKVLKAGICRTDLEIAAGYMHFTGVPGHEFVGTVEEADDKGLIGARVTGEINCGCGKCEYCERDEQAHCVSRTVLGIAGRDGAFAEYLTLPERNLHQIPEYMSDAEAVFIEPLAAAYRITEQVPVRSMAVLVLGDGKLGILIAQALEVLRANVTLCGRHKKKLDILKGKNIATLLEGELKPGKKYEVVVDATGRPEGVKKALGFVRPRGNLILKTTIAAPTAEIDLNHIVINEISVIGSRCGPFVHALALMETGQITLEPMIEASYPLEEGLKAFEHAARPGALKVLVG